MTIIDQLVEYLANSPEGADDATLASVLKVTRNQINQRCRRLAQAGMLKRERSGGVLKNVLVPGAAWPARRSAIDVMQQPWHWEGHVQQRIVEYLRFKGCEDVKSVNTATREAGKDITARFDQQRVWVTVKGSPEGTPRTSRYTQARHWFKGAFFDLLEWRGEDGAAMLYMGLPDFITYRHMVERVRWLAPQLRHRYLWVHQDGTVTEEDGAAVANT